jgi:hypothetical protein
MNDFTSKHNNPYLVFVVATSNKRGAYQRISSAVYYINLSNGLMYSDDDYDVSTKINKISVGGMIFKALQNLKG